MNTIERQPALFEGAMHYACLNEQIEIYNNGRYVFCNPPFVMRSFQIGRLQNTERPLLYLPYIFEQALIGSSRSTTKNVE